MLHNHSGGVGGRLGQRGGSADMPPLLPHCDEFRVVPASR